MQSANGITQSLERIIADKWNNFYSAVQDVVNTVHAVHASSFALYQSLYEERTITEDEYKKEQAEIRKSTRNLDKGQQALALPETSEVQEADNQPKKK